MFTKNLQCFQSRAFQIIWLTEIYRGFFSAFFLPWNLTIFQNFRPHLIIGKPDSKRLKCSRMPRNCLMCRLMRIIAIINEGTKSCKFLEQFCYIESVCCEKVLLCAESVGGKLPLTVENFAGWGSTGWWRKTTAIRALNTNLNREIYPIKFEIRRKLKIKNSFHIRNCTALWFMARPYSVEGHRTRFMVELSGEDHR